MTNDNINKDPSVNASLSAMDNSRATELSDTNDAVRGDSDVRAGGAYLELLEERPVVNKERLDVGKVTVTKHSRNKTISVPIELIEEYMVIETHYNDPENQEMLLGSYDDKDMVRHAEPTLDSTAVVTINGKQVAIGDEPVEIILSRQVAIITKDTYAIQEVAINKTTHTHTDTVQVSLRHEELDVQEEGFLAHEQSDTRK